MFDPYAKWLGLPAGERPPTYYDLLDINPDETNTEAVEEAANAQIMKLKPHRKGPKAEECGQLLDEIAAARDTLLDPAERKKYDAEIGLTPAKKSTAVTTAPRKEQVSPAVASKKVGGKPKKPEPKKGSALTLILGVGALLLLLLFGGGGAAAYFLFAKPKAEPITEQVAANGPTGGPTVPDKPKEPPPATKPAAPPATKPAAPPVAPPVTPPVNPPPPPPPAPPPVPPPAPVRVKLPMPDAAAQAKAEQTIKETYKAEYAKTKPEEILALSAKFLVPGRENRNDAAEWFVMLREARDLAVKAERPRLAVEAVREISEWFIVDAAAMAAQVLADVGKSTNEAVAVAVAQVALAESRRAIADEKYDAALNFVKLAESAAGKTKDKVKEALTERVTMRKADIAQIQKDFPAVEAARKKLKDAPQDADANLLVGRHLCFASGKWDEGLLLLAKGSDPSLKTLAEKDLAKPPGGAPLLALADLWLDYAYEQAEKPNGKPKVAPLVRAKFWYERLDPKAADDTRKKAAERIATATRIAPSTAPRLQPGSFASRLNPEEKVLFLREGGGNLKSEEAVDAGLKWLAEHQSVFAKGPSAGDGRWSLEGFQHTAKCKNRCSEPAEGKRDIAGTALGLLPFLGAGETHQKGTYSNNVKRGLAFLLFKQQKDGSFDGNMYDHGLATIAVCEAYALTRDPGLGAPAQAALQFIVQAQDPGGSWGYSQKTKGDTSVSGWQFTALKTGFFAGLRIPAAPFTRLAKHLDAVATPDGLGYGYNAPAWGKATSAVGLLCREFMGWSPYSIELSKGVDHLINLEDLSAVGKEQFSIYYVYYAVQLMHHYGGPKWEKWNYKVRDRLIDLQDKGDDAGYEHQKGSWSPYKDAWAKQGGRLMYTSFALLALETYYHHVPLNGYGHVVMEE